MSSVPAHLFPPHLNQALADAETELRRAALRFADAGPVAPGNRPRRRELLDLVRNFLRVVSIHKTFQGLDPETQRIPGSRRPLLLPPAVLETLPLLESALAALLPSSPGQPWDAPEFRAPCALFCRLIAVRRELGPNAPPSGFPSPSAPESALPPDAGSPLDRAYDPTSLEPAHAPTCPPAAPSVGRVSDPTSSDAEAHAAEPSPEASSGTDVSGYVAPSLMRPISPIGPILPPPDAPSDAPAARSLRPCASAPPRFLVPSHRFFALLFICVHRCASVVPALFRLLTPACPLFSRFLASALPPPSPAFLSFAHDPVRFLRPLDSACARLFLLPQQLARPQPP